MVFSLWDAGPAGRMHPETEQTPNSRHHRREFGTKALRTSRSASTAATHHGNRPARSSRRAVQEILAVRPHRHRKPLLLDEVANGGQRGTATGSRLFD